MLNKILAGLILAVGIVVASVSAQTTKAEARVSIYLGVPGIYVAPRRARCYWRRNRYGRRYRYCGRRTVRPRYRRYRRHCHIRYRYGRRYRVCHRHR